MMRFTTMSDKGRIALVGAITAVALGLGATAYACEGGGGGFGGFGGGGGLKGLSAMSKRGETGGSEYLGGGGRRPGPIPGSMPQSPCDMKNFATAQEEAGAKKAGTPCEALKTKLTNATCLDKDQEFNDSQFLPNECSSPKRRGEGLKYMDASKKGKKHKRGKKDAPSFAMPAPLTPAPLAPAPQPAAPAPAPQAPVEKPAAPVEKPAAPVEKPAAPAPKPAAQIPAQKPVVAPKPVNPVMPQHQPTLPKTGSDPVNALHLAGGLLVLGTGVTLVARRRTRRHSA